MMSGVRSDDMYAEYASVCCIGHHFDKSVGGTHGASFARGCIHRFARDGGYSGVFARLCGHTHHGYFGMSEYSRRHY